MDIFKLVKIMSLIAKVNLFIVMISGVFAAFTLDWKAIIFSMECVIFASCLLVCVFGEEDMV